MAIKYINLFTSFGFKKIFVEEDSKPLLIDFLNALSPELKIVDLSFTHKQTPKTIENLVYCRTQSGKNFMLDLRKENLKYVRERIGYYDTFPLESYLKNADSAYSIVFLGFTFGQDQDKIDNVVHHIKLKDYKKEPFYKHLNFIYLEMPNFDKTIEQLETRLDKWLYFIKHLDGFDTIPDFLQDPIFLKAFEKAEIYNYSPQEQEAYQYSLKIFRDNAAVYQYAYKTGLALGREKLKFADMHSTIQVLQSKGKTPQDISGLLDLSEAEIQRIIALFK